MKWTSSRELTVLLIAVGIVLGLSSLGLPWYKLEFTGYSDLLEEGFYKGEYTCFREYFVLDDLGYHTIGLSPWYGGISEYTDLMTIETMLVALSAISSIFWIGTVLYGRRNLAIVCGALSAGATIVALAYYALSVGDAISIYMDDSIAPDIPDGFVGSGTDDSDADWSWGPSSGWFALLASASVMSVTVILQALVPKDSDARK